MILTGKQRYLERDLFHRRSVDRIPTWTGLGSNPDLHIVQPTTDCMCHETASRLCTREGGTPENWLMRAKDKKMES